MHTILITGGSGYIGSHIAYHLNAQGYRVIIIDPVMPPQALSQIPHYRQRCGDYETLCTIITQHHVDAVIHCAGRIEVGESVKDPHAFYDENVQQTSELLRAMRTTGVTNILFASSCAVYGIPQQLPLTEDHPTCPVNPYGRTKLACEWMLEDFAAAYELKYVSLRFFNASGGLFKQGLGEKHNPETHLLPLLCRAVLTDKAFTILGTDYPTPDGTCTRDYIAVQDIAIAHEKALAYLNNDGISTFLNLGGSRSYSVREMIGYVEQVAQKKAAVIKAPRRDGDPAQLVANASRAEKLLNWKPTIRIEQIVQQAYEWEKLSITL